MPPSASTPPQRVPPPSSRSAAAGCTQTAVVPSGAAVVAPTLTRDAYALQAQLDHLGEQFDHLRAQLRQAQKLATLGTTAAMIAHELNNLLTPVMAYAREALDRDDVGLMRLALGKTLERVAAIRDMADRVVGLARQPDTVVRSVPLGRVVQEALACLGRDPAKDGIEVRLLLDPELCVRANESQLLQVLFNLVTNARQAMLGRRGRLTIEGEHAPGGQVHLHVRDTGCGIPAEHLADVFDPFFSTKQNADRPDQRGLGLGLAICRDIIEELGGRIDLDSTVGEGTTVTLTLPQGE